MTWQQGLLGPEGDDLQRVGCKRVCPCSSVLSKGPLEGLRNSWPCSRAMEFSPSAFHLHSQLLVQWQEDSLCRSLEHQGVSERRGVGGVLADVQEAGLCSALTDRSGSSTESRNIPSSPLDNRHPF